MERKILLIGFALVILSFIIGSIALPNALSGISKFSSQNIALLQGKNAYLHYYINQTGFVVVGYQSNSKLNFYFANASGFSILKNYLNTTITLAQWAKRLQGNGVIESIPNSTLGIFPYTQFASANAIPSGSYSASNLTLLAPGDYYAIFQNIGNASATVNVTSDISTNIKAQGPYIFGIGLSVFLVFVAGIIVVIYGIIKKNKQASTQQPENDQKKIDDLYKGVDKHHKGKAKK